MQRKYKLVVIVILSLFLIGGASMVLIKEVEHLRIERQKCQKAESIKESKKEVKARQKIALWVVQHYEGPEIKIIEIGKIKTHGILGSGGSSVSVVINSKKKNMIEGIGVDEQGDPISAGFSFTDSDYKYVEEKLSNKNLDGINILYWEEENDTRFK
ncbi:hypothetical protein [uncultured Ligilactobacillus sp.]|uniref:hypothetical protein n=1 Tax=uncultured Ligilactobacillus sp. TaxID=2837633 RepID=UPI00272C9442|nr:hypothetical protein [uncultured Ligilactobacillus sp.]